MALERIDVGPDFAERFATGLSTGLADLTNRKIADWTGGQARQPQGGFGTQQNWGLGGDFAKMQGQSGGNFRDQLAAMQFQNKLQEQERKTRLTETKDARKSISEAAKGAKENLVNIERMEQLIDTGKLTGPIQNNLMNRIGLGGWRNPETQEFEKLSTDFLRNAKAIFGARVTQGEVNRYLQTIPTLMQSDAGKRAVIKNMRRYNEAAILRNDAQRAIISANGGIPPLNLEEQIDQLVGPQLDALKQEVLGRQGFDELPSPEQYVGRKIKSDAGEILQSDGKQWKRIS